MQQRIKNELALITLVVVCGSAGVIWGYNKILGRDLSEPPRFDLSAYEDLGWPTPEEVFADMQTSDDAARKQAAVDAFAKAAADQAGKAPLAGLPVGKQATEQPSNPTTEHPINTDSSDEITVNALLSRHLYFAKQFKGDTPLATRQALEKFLKNFSGLVLDTTYQDLQANHCFNVTLPVDGREELVASLEMEIFVQSLKANPAPAGTFALCLVEPKYYENMQGVLKNYPSVVVSPLDAPATPYSATLGYDPVKPEHMAAIAKIKQLYADVVTVVE